LLTLPRVSYGSRIGVSRPLRSIKVNPKRDVRRRRMALLQCLPSHGDAEQEETHCLSCQASVGIAENRAKT
jgi:hypothetical protein